MGFQDLIQLLKSKFKESSLSERIVAIYTYGSIVKGRLRNDSDIDIAMLPSFETDVFEKLQLISKVEAIVTSATKSSGIDKEVSVLDMRGKYVSLQLLYKIITEGIIIYENNPLERINFENAVKGEYFDFIPYLLYLRERKYGDLYKKV